MEIVIFVGLPGCGKSTYYRRHFSPSHVQISKDLLSPNAAKEKQQRRLVEEAIGRGASIVVDNTNPSRQSRAWLIERARLAGYRVRAYYFACPAAVAIERNNTREGKERVPTVAIFTTRKKLEPPTLEEGFDEVVTITD